jgi:hypothetical protein
MESSANMAEDTQRDDTPRRPSTLPSLLAIGGAIILLVIIVWGLVHLANLSLPWFSGTDTGTITLSAPETIRSGTVFTLSWTHDTEEAGSYALLYGCAEGVQMAIPAAEASYRAVPCGAAVTLGSGAHTIDLLPLSTSNSTIPVTLSILFIPDAAGTTGPEVSGSLTVSLLPGEIETPVANGEEKPAEEPWVPEAPTTPTPRPATPADLVVTIVRVTVDGYGNGAAVFDIANRGGRATGSYYFTATLPTAQPYTYSSPAQASLAPGAHVQSTLSFTQGVSGVFSVTADPAGAVAESNESNNTATQSVSGPHYQYPQYY